MNKRKSMSRYAFLLLGIVIMSEPVLSYGYTIKQPLESELSAYGNALEDTDQNATVEVAPRELVSWKVYFVDEESRQIQLSAMRSGTILEGEELVIPYANSLIVNGHRWLANEDSPYRINVYGPGEKIIYITYSDEGSVGDADDPEASERERFEMYLERVKKADAAITGKEAEEILDDQIICESNAKCSYRLRSLSTQIKNTAATPVYVIAKDCAATGVILKELYSTSVEYSTNLLDTIQLDGAEYRIYVFLVNKKFGETCSHNWKLEKRTEATCLSSGSEKYVCSICSKTEVKTLPALGHVDENGDSLCDRCGKRTEEQNDGDRITATYRPSQSEYQMQFVCVSENFQNGYLYISDTGIPASEFGGYGSLDYMLSNPYQAFVGTFADCFSITGQALMPIDADGALAYAAIMSKEEVLAYRGQIEGDYITRTVENGQLVVVHEDGSTSLVAPTDDMLLRPAIVLSAPDAGTADPIYWSVGDVQKVVIDQKTYEFRCVDTNYYDKSENHQKLALFLCDDVIPANYGSEYSYLPDKEGIMGQVFLPGPVVNFGDESDYKYSKIHNWLSKHQNRIFQSFNCHIGVDSAFTGSTGKGRFSELSDQDLTVHSIGYQRLTARLFSLSVEEALKYKDYLWKFGDTDADNPEVVTDNFCNGYWLRSPMGNADANSGYAYIVDLVNGMIRPEAVKPDGSSTDEELRVTTSIGVRPAFAVPQG